MREFPPRNDAGEGWFRPGAIEASLRHLEDRLVRAFEGGRHRVGGEKPDEEGSGPLLLTANDLAEMLQISERQIWRMRDTGRLPVPIELGPKNIRWPREEILDWIDAGCPKRQVWEARKPKAGRGE